MTFRKVLFWVHLVAGVVAGSVILVMCVTGTLLTFQQSVLRLVERDQRCLRIAWLGQQSHGDFGDDGEQPFATGDQR